MLPTINRVIRTLVISDFFLMSAWGFLAPIFAIFIVQNIAVGGPAEAAKVAGFASFAYWGVKSLFQIPIGRYLDKKHGEKDDFWFMIFGLFLTGLAPFGFLLASLPWHIYLLQFFHGLGMAAFIPAWNAVFTRHIDKGKEAFEWAIDSSFLGIGYGIAGAIGGLMVAVFGFKMIFVLVGTLTIISSLILFAIYKDILPRDHLKIPHPNLPIRTH